MTIDPDIEPLVHALREMGADVRDHSGRTLLDHLLGVYALLRDWGDPPALRLAGLFHSIYGTVAFRHSSAAVEDRDRIRALIGVTAEQLAYLFCACDQRELLRRAASMELGVSMPSVALMDTKTGSELAVPQETFRALAEIGVANLIDQLPFLIAAVPPPRVARLVAGWGVLRDLISEPARRALAAAQASLPPPGDTQHESAR